MHELNSLTASEYFKLHGTLPASVIEHLLNKSVALDAVIEYIAEIEPVELENVELYDETSTQLVTVENELKAVLVPQHDAMIQFGYLKAEVSKFDDMLKLELGQIGAIKTKLEELTCNM